jgi:hypothetical protein
MEEDIIYEGSCPSSNGHCYCATNIRPQFEDDPNSAGGAGDSNEEKK